MERSFIELCWLLNRVKTRERDLHRFLKENYQILDSHLAAIFSEVPIRQVSGRPSSAVSPV